MAAGQVVYWPSANPVVTEEAGTRGGTHSGIDLAASLGDPVLAAFDGIAEYVGGDGASGRIWLGDRWLYPNGQGKTVDIRRTDGVLSRVGHLNGYNIQQGQRVKAGDVIGYAGMTGYSTGVHIHWETRWDRAWSGGNWVDPRSFHPQTFQAAATIRKDTRMHAVRQIGQPDSGIILGGGQPPRARHESVFIAECNALGITPVDVPDWQYGTVVREAWTDFSTTAGIIADAVAGKLPKGAPTAPLGISDADAQRIAEAVANEHAERLKK